MTPAEIQAKLEECGYMMSSRIEDAVAARLAAFGIDAEAKIKKASTSKIRLPQELYVFFESADAEVRQLGRSLQITARLMVELRYRRATGEETMRRGAEHIRETVIMLLFGQRLGLKMEPLTFKRYRNVFHEKDGSQYFSVMISFDAAYAISVFKETDPNVQDLLKVTAKYAEPADMTDIKRTDVITIGQGGA